MPQDRECYVCRRKIKVMYLALIFYGSRSYECCPRCALTIRNIIHSYSENEGFSGEEAKALYDDYLDYLKKKEEEIETWRNAYKLHRHLRGN